MYVANIGFWLVGRKEMYVVCYLSNKLQVEMAISFLHHNIHNHKNIKAQQKRLCTYMAFSCHISLKSKQTNNGFQNHLYWASVTSSPISYFVLTSHLWQMRLQHQAKHLKSSFFSKDKNNNLLDVTSLHYHAAVYYIISITLHLSFTSLLPLILNILYFRISMAYVEICVIMQYPYPCLCNIAHCVTFLLHTLFAKFLDYYYVHQFRLHL